MGSSIQTPYNSIKGFHNTFKRSTKEDLMKVFQTEHSKGIIVGNIKNIPVKLFPIKEQCFLN